MASKSSTDATPAMTPEPLQNSKMQNRLAYLEQLMEQIVSRRNKLGSYNTDAPDILTLAKAQLEILKILQDK